MELYYILKSSTYLKKVQTHLKYATQKRLKKSSKHYNRQIYKKRLCDAVISFNNRIRWSVYSYESSINT
jgi:hypothetical protein